MIHYHGTPITPRERLYELAGRHFCVSVAEPRDVKVCHAIGQSVMLDNGAYSFWKRGIGAGYGRWVSYYLWAEEWLDYPTTWAVIPDVVGGSEEANDALLGEWSRQQLPKGAPVWHLHETLDRLRRLADGYERVCFGSSGGYATVGTDQWHRRISEAFDAVADDAGRVPWIHMLRGMDQAGGPYPFASVDSTNAARNHAGSSKRLPRPISVMVAEMDAVQCPGRWNHVGTQLEVTA